MPDLARPLSATELTYLRNEFAEQGRAGNALIIFIGFLFFAFFGGFAALAFSMNGAILGWILAGLAAAVLAALIRHAIRWRSSSLPPMQFKTTVLTGELKIRTIREGKARRREYFIGPAPVDFPFYWRAPLEAVTGPLQVRAALPAQLEEASNIVPYRLIETANGLSVELEQAEIKAPLAKPNYLVLCIAIVSGVLALVCLQVAYRNTSGGPTFWIGSAGLVIFSISALFAILGVLRRRRFARKIADLYARNGNRFG
jgi:hypothetical protein